MDIVTNNLEFNVLYHFTASYDSLISILTDGYVFVNKNAIDKVHQCVCLTRNSNRNRVRLTFNRNNLKYNYKVSPFDFFGYYGFKNICRGSGFSEYEERCYDDISIKHIISIDININGKWINFNHLLKIGEFSE